MGLPMAPVLPPVVAAGGAGTELAVPSAAPVTLPPPVPLDKTIVVSNIPPHLRETGLVRSVAVAVAMEVLRLFAWGCTRVDRSCALRS